MPALYRRRATKRRYVRNLWLNGELAVDSHLPDAVGRNSAEPQVMVRPLSGEPENLRIKSRLQTVRISSCAVLFDLLNGVERSESTKSVLSNAEVFRRNSLWVTGFFRDFRETNTRLRCSRFCT